MTQLTIDKIRYLYSTFTHVYSVFLVYLEALHVDVRTVYPGIDVFPFVKGIRSLQWPIPSLFGDCCDLVPEDSQMQPAKRLFSPFIMDVPLPYLITGGNYMVHKVLGNDEMDINRHLHGSSRICR